MIKSSGVDASWLEKMEVVVRVSKGSPVKRIARTMGRTPKFVRLWAKRAPEIIKTVTSLGNVVGMLGENQSSTRLKVRSLLESSRVLHKQSSRRKFVLPARLSESTHDEPLQIPTPLFHLPPERHQEQLQSQKDRHINLPYIHPLVKLRVVQMPFGTK